MAEAARQDADRRLLRSLKRKEQIANLKRTLAVWNNFHLSFNLLERKPK
jgi:hypothetical protein